MMSRKISYEFRDEGVLAIENGQVIASASSLEELQITAGEDCPRCGKPGGCDHGPDEPHTHEAAVEDDEDYGDCTKCGNGAILHDGECADCKADRDSYEKEDNGKEAATHIVTPNGLKGKIMGRTKGLWGDQVTVKFENGHIAHLDTASISEFVAEKTAGVSSVEDQLREVLAASVDGTELGLKTREADLRDITDRIEALARSGRTDDELSELDSLRAQASYELGEVREALDHLATAEPYEPFAPYAVHVVEQESVGGHTSSWLDKVAQEMVAEANATDYDKLLNEGPEVFVASLETAPLADQGVVRTLASNYIRTKTAAARPEIREKYEELWLERVEACRKEEFAGRKQVIAKQASVHEAEIANATDESLFI